MNHWTQLMRFCAVGASGYGVNLAVFVAAHTGLDLEPVIAAAYAFTVAVTSNFVLNRRWTFAATGGSRRLQAPRYFAVSLAAFAVSASLLGLLHDEAGLPAIQAQAVAIVLVTPVSFLANRLWTFGAHRIRTAEA